MSTQSRLLAVLFCTCVFACDEGTVPVGGGGQIQVTDTFTLPVAELSSLTLRTVDGQRQLCAVGDGSSFIVVADVGQDGELTNPRKLEVGGLVSDAASSQWEGIASDGTGSLFVVQESGRVLVFSAGVDEVLGVIDLPSGNGNGGAEGLLLLANGHLLVVNEKDPVSLIELGPAGDASDGINAGLFAPAAFPLPDTATFVELGSWSVALDDVSDVAVSNGRLYVVSDEERAIAEVELPLSTGSDTAPLLERWPLPAEIEKPEGLVLLADGTPIVGADKPDGELNAYVLGPLE